MRRIFALLACLSLTAQPGAPAQAIVLNNAQASVYFSPNGGAQAALVEAILNARKNIVVQAYSFTSAAVARALTDAAENGIQVQVILDYSNLSDRYSVVDFLQRRGVPVLIDARHQIAHNKVMVIDNEVVITGSYNFTASAEDKNAENLLIIRDRALAGAYLANWVHHARHSEEPPERAR